eukprot:3771644-Rhodomonas_salina.2
MQVLGKQRPAFSELHAAAEMGDLVRITSWSSFSLYSRRLTCADFFSSSMLPRGELEPDDLNVEEKDAQ